MEMQAASLYMVIRTGSVFALANETSRILHRLTAWLKCWHNKRDQLF